MSFAYRAARVDGSIERGILLASNAEAAGRVLTERGLWVLEVAPASFRGFWRRGPQRIPIDQLALGLRVLADFLESGLPLAKSLSALQELAPTSWALALPAIRESIREGKSLGSALEAAPILVPTLVIGIVRAGEAGSGQARAIRHAAEVSEEGARMRAAVRGALTYPIILASAGTSSVALLTGVVLPRFADLLADLNQVPPLTTQVVLNIASIVRESWIPTLFLVLVAGTLLRLWTLSDEGLRRWHEVLLRMPVVGALRRSAATAQVSNALSALLANGVPIAPALAHASRASGDAALSERLRAAREKVIQGNRLSRALAMHDAATLTMVRLVRAGEETGRLAVMLAHAARLDREFTVRRTRWLVRLLEPTLIIAFGSVVALAAAALLQALYAVRPSA